jgi:hypothetical protein
MANLQFLKSKEDVMGDRDWCRNCRHSSGHLDALWCNRHDEYVDKYGWCKDFSWPESGGDGGGGCYIATATLGTTNRPQMLQMLRAWRAECMRPYRLGRWLEAQYDVIGPQIVQQMLHNQVMRGRYFRWFVQPAVALVQRRPQSKMPWVYNLSVYLIFVAGLIAGQIHKQLTTTK